MYLNSVREARAAITVTTLMRNSDVHKMLTSTLERENGTEYIQFSRSLQSKSQDYDDNMLLYHLILQTHVPAKISDECNTA